MRPPRLTAGVVRAVMLALLAAACQTPSRSTADDEAAAPAPAAESGSGEILLGSPPEGWVEAGSMRTPVLRMAEYAPPGETEGELERITFEAQAGKPLPDPIDFVLSVSRSLEVRCNEYQDVNVSSGFENGYPTSVRLMICPKFKDSPNGQVVLAKAIRGEENFYVITRRLRVRPLKDLGQPLSNRAMAAWTTHLKRISVCDTRDDAHPCPPSVTADDDPTLSAPEAPPGRNDATDP